MVCCRKILILLCIFFVLFCFTSYSFCSTEVSESDAYSVFTDKGIQVQDSMITAIYGLSRDDAVTILTRIKSYLGMLGRWNMGIYVQPAPTDNEAFRFNIVYLDSHTFSFQNVNYTSMGIQARNIPVYDSITFWYVASINNNGGVDLASYSWEDTSTKPCYYYLRAVSPRWIQALSDFGLVSSDTEKQELLNSINSVTQNINTSIQNQTSQQHQDSEDIKNTLQNQTSQQHQDSEDIKNTLTDNSVEDIDTSAIQNSDTTQDITSGGFDNIFTSIQNAILDDSEHSVDITIPFVNMTLTISKSSIFGNFSGLSVIENLCSMVWYFLVSVFIVKDISKKINAIKSGNIENVQNTNIKEDLL